MRTCKIGTVEEIAEDYHELPEQVREIRYDYTKKAYVIKFGDGHTKYVKVRRWLIL